MCLVSEKSGFVTGGNAGAALLPRCQRVVAMLFEGVFVQVKEKPHASGARISS